MALKQTCLNLDEMHIKFFSNEKIKASVMIRDLIEQQQKYKDWKSRNNVRR